MEERIKSLEEEKEDVKPGTKKKPEPAKAPVKKGKGKDEIPEGGLLSVS